MKGNILLHCYLNQIEVNPLHKQEIKLMLSKAYDLMGAFMELTRYANRTNLCSLYLIKQVIFFQQYLYQGLWVEDSPFKQLPHITKRVRVNAVGLMNRKKTILSQERRKSHLLSLFAGILLPIRVSSISFPISSVISKTQCITTRRFTLR